MQNTKPRVRRCGKEKLYRSDNHARENTEPRIYEQK